jgi:hypothetical protein
MTPMEELRASTYDQMRVSDAGAKTTIAADGLPDSVHRAALDQMVQNKQITEKMAKEAADPANLRPGETPEAALARLEREHIEETFKDQKAMRDQGQKPPLLGQMLVDRGYATQEQVDAAMKAQDTMRAAGQNPLPRIGDIIVDQMKTNAGTALGDQFAKSVGH